ncbi:MAG: hypothetical protein J6N32_11260 [Clostridia bacterium]|nr:hypothetical protein [Clostridia bacterium]
MKIRIKVRLADGTYEYRWVDVGQSPGGGRGLPEYTSADEGKVLMIVGGKPAWVTVQTAPAEEVVLMLNDDGSIAVSGVEFTVQDDGAVLVGGAGIALQDDGAVLIK